LGVNKEYGESRQENGRRSGGDTCDCDWRGVVYNYLDVAHADIRSTFSLPSVLMLVKAAAREWIS
jgi:hypothetical protein